MAKNKSKRKLKKEDRLAIIAAIITSLFIIGGLTFVGYNLFFKDQLGITKGSEQKVPDLLGKDFNTVKDFYNDPDKFTIEGEEKYDDEYEKGRIISQDPNPNIVVKIPQQIKVVVSKGPKTIKVPDLANIEYRQAELDLEGKDLRYKVIYEYHNTIPEGIVIRHIPEEGVEINAGDVVQLYVSEGRKIEMVRVPNLLGKDEDEAKRLITQRGLLVGEITPDISDKPKGIVIGQELPANSEVEEKTLIDFTVSKGRPSQEIQRYINIPLPQDKEKVNIKIEYYKQSSTQGEYVFDKIAYQKMHSTSEGEGVATIALSGRGTIYIAVYIDNERLGDEYTKIEFGGDVE